MLGHSDTQLIIQVLVLLKANVMSVSADDTPGEVVEDAVWFLNL